MNQKTEAKMIRMSDDVHILTWPFRFVRDFIYTCLFVIAFVLLVPSLFIGLAVHHMVTGQAILDEDSVLALKVLFCFCQPFILPIVYRFAQIGCVKRNRAQVKAHFCVSMHWIFVAVVVLELVGALVNYSWWDSMTTEGSLAVLVLYLSSPLVFLIFRRDQSSVPLPSHRPQRSSVIVWTRCSRSVSNGVLRLPPKN